MNPIVQYAITFTVGAALGSFAAWMIIWRKRRASQQRLHSDQRQKLYRQLAGELSVMIFQLESRLQMEMYSQACAPSSLPISKQQEVAEEYQNVQSRLRETIIRRNHLISDEVAEALIHLLAQLRLVPSVETSFDEWTQSLADHGFVARQCFELITEEAELDWELPS